MKVTLEILGKRLQELRKDLNLSQQEVAQQLGYPQNALSKLETGKGVGIDFLLELIHFYKERFFIDALFLEEPFVVLRRGKDQNSVHSVVIERLKVLEEDVRIEVEQLIKLLR